MEQLRKLYIKWAGVDPTAIDELPHSGSTRIYYRIHAPKGVTPETVIGAVGTSIEENHAFAYISKCFKQERLSVPEVYTISEDGLLYLQEDLGHQTLFQLLMKGREAGGRYNSREKEWLKETISLLPDLQFRGGRHLDFTQCYPQAEMDRTNILFDLNYFKYCFLKATEMDFHEIKLEANFQMLANELLEEQSNTFMYRDFQARNVMISPDNRIYFIDFQGGRKGPIYYDVASFLWQASAKYSPELRNELIEIYLSKLGHYIYIKEGDFRKKLDLFVLFRMLQVLGAYGFRGYFERKPHFLQSIPPAMENLRQLLKNSPRRFPYLTDLLQRLTELPQFAPQDKEAIDGPATHSKYDGKGPLVVRVYSFSYHKGIPEDTSGNGGGYVFDCRSTHNPGRYAPYKKLTGLDEPVIRFLENDGEILTFLESVYKLVDAHVERFMQRGFTDLMISFGCTGGQHRSVYSAQHTAEHIHNKYGIEVKICHREQQIEQNLPAVNP